MMHAIAEVRKKEGVREREKRAEKCKIQKNNE
jgi:hypothetical protein